MEVGLTGRSDLGENYFYAPQSLTLPDGRRVTLGWMQDGRTRARRLAAGWAGSMSIPREVQVAADGTLRFRPVAEVASLRTRPLIRAGGEAARGAALRGRSVDLLLTGVVKNMCEVPRLRKMADPSDPTVDALLLNQIHDLTCFCPRRTRRVGFVHN